jgi:hypothetical protein
LFKRQRFSVYLQLIGFGIDGGIEIAAGNAVDFHLAGGNQLVCLAARAQSGFGNRLVEPQSGARFIRHGYFDLLLKCYSISCGLPDLWVISWNLVES